MAAPLIEQTLSATSATSDSVLGYDLGRAETHAYAGVQVTAACFQCVRVQNTGDYTVTLEAGIVQSDNSVDWSTVATVTQDEDTNITTFTLAPGARYRFVRDATSAAGVTIKCLLN